MASNAPGRTAWKSVVLSHEMLLLYVLVAEWLFFYFAGTSTNRRGWSSASARSIGSSIFCAIHVKSPAGARAHAGDSHRWHRSVGGVAARPVRDFVRQALARWRTFDPAPRRRSPSDSAAIGGGINASLITGLRLPPLIVTLGLTRCSVALAEAITHGAITYTDFPDSFLFSRARSLAWAADTGVVVSPGGGNRLATRAPDRRSGRSFRAIGYSPEGARYAGLPVNRRIAMVYVLAGLIAALAAIIYTHDSGRRKRMRAPATSCSRSPSRARRHEHLGGSGSVAWHIARRVAAIAVAEEWTPRALPVVMRLNAAEEMSACSRHGALLLLALSWERGVPNVVYAATEAPRWLNFFRVLRFFPPIFSPTPHEIPPAPFFPLVVCDGS